MFILTAVLLLTLISPFGIYYAIGLAKKLEYEKHRKIHNIIFLVCAVGVLSLEGLIRYSGGSGSIASKSDYYGTDFFTLTLTSHIIVAVLTYLLWSVLIIISNRKFRKSLPGKLSKIHKNLGYIIFCGLIYTALTALIIYLMSLNLV